MAHEVHFVDHSNDKLVANTHNARTIITACQAESNGLKFELEEWQAGLPS